MYRIGLYIKFLDLSVDNHCHFPGEVPKDQAGACEPAGVFTHRSDGIQSTPANTLEE